MAIIYHSKAIITTWFDRFEDEMERLGNKLF